MLAVAGQVNSLRAADVASCEPFGFRIQCAAMRKTLCLVLLALAGCQSVEQASTPRMIAFAGVTDSTIGDTTNKAQAHCQKYGRDAEVAPDGNRDGRVTFRCL